MIEITYWGLGLIIAMIVASFFLGVGLGTWLEDRAIAKRQIDEQDLELPMHPAEMFIEEHLPPPTPSWPSEVDRLRKFCLMKELSWDRYLALYSFLIDRDEMSESIALSLYKATGLDQQFWWNMWHTYKERKK